MRWDALAGLERFGIAVDRVANKAHESGGERCISTPESEVRVLVIPPTNEELAIARAADALAKSLSC